MGSPAEPDSTRDRSLLDLVQVVVVSLDRSGHVRMINRKGCEILGRTSDEVVGRDWFRNFVPARMRDDVRAVFERLMSGHLEEIASFENPVVARDGRERLIAWHNTVLRDGAGRPSGTLSSGEEVTERRRFEEQLQRSNRELSDIKDALDQAAIVAMTDQRGAIGYVNDKFCEISKYSREELLGQDHRIVNSGHHPKSFFRTLWRTIASGRVWRGEIRNRAKDGSIYWVDTTIVPFLDERNKPYQYLAIRSDITERKRAERELRERETLTKLGQMAAVMAHEVRNPLAGIGGAVQVIGSHLPADSPDREIIASILERIDALNQKVEDVLAYSRPRPLSLDTLPVHVLVAEVVDFLQKDPRLAGIDLAADTRELVLRCDGQLLREVLTNLVLNAVEALGGRGTIRVSTLSQNGWGRIEVRDDGPGVPVELRQRVFEPFFSTRNNGTGLGLAIARRVVEDHGGSVELDCPPGGGTIVTLRLPRP